MIYRFRYLKGKRKFLSFGQSLLLLLLLFLHVSILYKREIKSEKDGSNWENLKIREMYHYYYYYYFFSSMMSRLDKRENEIKEVWIELEKFKNS